MRILIIVLLSLYTVNASAVFQKIWQGYQISSFNQSQLLDKKINDANYRFQLNKYDWQFEVKPEHDNTFLAALFSFQSQKTIKNTLTYGFVKPSYKWGTFSLKQLRRDYDLSGWTGTYAQNLASTHMYETQNIMTYSYDFLDKSSGVDYDIVNTQNEAGKAQAQLNVDQGYFDFFTVYLQAKLQVFSVQLNKEFVKRAQKRVNLIRTRVKDGLSRRVELHQAKSSLLNQKESLEKARSSLKNNLAVLENIIGKKIKESDFGEISWRRRTFSYWDKYIKSQSHYSLEVLKKNLEQTEKMLEKVSNESGYKLLLSASYLSNNIDQSAGKSVSNSLTGKHYSKNISLNFVIPLGGSKKDNLRKKYLFQRKKNELDLLTKKDELETKKDALLERISFLEKATGYSKEKVDLSKQILNEQNRLYLRGQATFEEVIRAEESYINAELSEKMLFAEYETLIANYAFFNNSIKQILDIYQD